MVYHFEESKRHADLLIKGHGSHLQPTLYADIEMFFVDAILITREAVEDRCHCSAGMSHAIPSTPSSIPYLDMST